MTHQDQAPAGHRHDAPEAAGHAAHTHESKHDTHTVKDPVCGMRVDPHTARHRVNHQGRPYYFCSAGCQAKFEADPDQYLARGATRPDLAPDGAIYTCPMHPEIRQAGPGSCPICGMALCCARDGAD